MRQVLLSRQQSAVSLLQTRMDDGGVKERSNNETERKG